MGSKSSKQKNNKIKKNIPNSNNFDKNRESNVNSTKKEKNKNIDNNNNNKIKCSLNINQIGDVNRYPDIKEFES